jgi:cell division protein FtsI (penicillin-binding protein 3)
VDEPIAKQIAALASSRASPDARVQAPVPRRANRRARGRASPTSKTTGQEGIELSFNKALGGQAGSQRVIKDRLGRVVEGRRRRGAARGRQGTSSCPSISKVQFFAYQKLRGTAVTMHKANARAAWWCCAITGESAGAGQLPELRARQAANLTGRAVCATAR